MTICPRISRRRLRVPAWIPTVLVQAAATVAETLFMLELARDNAFIAGVVGWVDFESPMAPDTIATLAEDSRLVGLRPDDPGHPGRGLDAASPRWRRHSKP